jgi:hypothetical protein
MDYRLELLPEDTFEKLTNTICQKILGIGVISFATGKDGARDGKFTGTAQHYPSDAEKWHGKFIIQAKHTSNPIASCSDKDFQSTINQEIIKVKGLKANNEIDNYMVFTNRKYTGVKGEQLLKKIIDETKVLNTVIIGKETINNQFLNTNKDIIRQYKLDQYHIPFNFSDEEIKEIILAFKEQLPNITDDIKKEVDRLKYDYTHIAKNKKNAKNKLSESYYKEEILSKSLMEFDKIEQFLNDPINSQLKEYYYDTAHELNQIINLKRDSFDLFEDLFVYIYQLICDGEVKLKGSKRHLTTFLHYMYMECLIGKK